MRYLRGSTYIKVSHRYPFPRTATAALRYRLTEMLPIDSRYPYLSAPSSSSFPPRHQPSLDDVLLPLESPQSSTTQPSVRLAVMVSIFCISLFGAPLSLDLGLPLEFNLIISQLSHSPPSRNGFAFCTSHPSSSLSENTLALVSSSYDISLELSYLVVKRRDPFDRVCPPLIRCL